MYLYRRLNSCNKKIFYRSFVKSLLTFSFICSVLSGKVVRIQTPSTVLLTPGPKSQGSGRQIMNDRKSGDKEGKKHHYPS